MQYVRSVNKRDIIDVYVTKLILANAIYRIIAKKAICFDKKVSGEYSIYIYGFIALTYIILSSPGL